MTSSLRHPDFLFIIRSGSVSLLLAGMFCAGGCSAPARPTPPQPARVKSKQTLPQTAFVLAEDNAQVAVVGVTRATRFTSVRLQAQMMLSAVCWAAMGTDSPYLEAGEHRYRFLGGDNLTTCPVERNYAEREEMVLRFETVDSQANKVSLIEGKGGEDQLLGRASASNRRFWNFLDIPLK
ncbi:MAG TPA: hypothetical protein VK210_08120 [Terriglobia bacterium]|nr:hypothetical protein [Terriglobia bacterium]